MDAMTIVYWIVGTIFTVAALLTVVRIVKGPTILDRIVASDVLLTTLALVLGTEMVVNGHTRTIPLLVVIAATATFSTIAVARYVVRRDGVTQLGDPQPEDAWRNDS